MTIIYKTILAFIVFYTIGGISVAQDDQNKPKPTGGKGTISGIVIDKSSNLPMEGSAITIFEAKDTLKIKGTETNSKGMFSVEVPFGKYKIEINEVGYSMAAVDGIIVSPKNPDVTLDTIRIKQATTTTDEIDVTANKNVIELTADKKIFNVEKSIVSSNGSATDILKNVPSVSVDNDGNVSLKGSQNVRIMIDGRPVYNSVATVLDGIPASSVQSIELITNPSAKYEAEGESGIINIVLKKNSEVGYNGSVMLSTGTKDKYNGAVNLSVKKNRINVYANYSFQKVYFGITGTGLTLNSVNNVNSSLDQSLSGYFNNMSNLGKAGFDYKLTDKQTLGLTSTLSYRKRNRPYETTNSFYDASNTLSMLSYTHSSSAENGYNFDAALDYNARFKQPDHTFSMEASYVRSYEDTPIDVDNTYTIINYLPSTIPDGQISTDQVEKRNTANLQADYSHPLCKDSKVQTGFKSTYKLFDNTFNSEHVDTISNTWVTDYGLNNRFKYTEIINALYATYSNKFGNFEFQAGVRTEMTNDKGELSNSSQNFSSSYIDFFPSASISEKLNKENEFDLSYSRRLNRPRPGFLNPFGENTDPYNLRTGNPQLKPEYIDSYELSYLKYITGAVITSSVYFRETHGLISRLKTAIDSVTTMTTWVNLSKAYSYGFELIASVQTPKWLNFTGSFSYYNIQIVGDNIQSELSNSGSSWFTKFLTTVNLWYGFDLQMAYNYQSRNPTVDGYYEPFQTFDVSLRREIVKKKFEMSMRVSDLFNTQEYRQYAAGDGYIQNQTFKRDSRVAYLTLTYRFGNVSDEQKHEKSKKPKDDSPPDIEN